MSSTAFSQQNSSSIQTRRTPAKNDDTESSSQRPSNRRSLSGKFRSLFQKNSSSPSRSSQNDGRSATASTRQRSPSPEPIRASTEAPHLRAPIIPWPFGKKKSKSTATTTTTKRNSKSKKTPAPSVEISNPIYQQEHQTSIRGQNFVPRTPELTHGATGRTQSSSSYENTTKGFRDYTIIDRRKSTEQEIGFGVDATTSPPYPTDRSRSPSLDHQHLPDTSIEHSYHYDTSSPRISEIETISISKQPHTVIDTSSYTTTQVLVENTPVLPLTHTQSTNSTINSNQWKNISHSSLNNTELRSTTTSGSTDVTIPKLQTPLIPLSSRSSKKDSKRTTFQSQNDDTYSSSSTVNNLLQTNRSSSTKTYGSLPDTSTMNNNDTFTSWKSTNSDMEKYPGISAIIEHHMRPSSVRFNERSPTTSSQRTQRFDTSTTTVNDYEKQQQQQQQPQPWSTTLTNGSALSPSSIHHHDGYIRPLTPEKPSLQPDVSMLHVNLDDLRGQSSHYHSPDPPIMYRSSTIIYTRDKHHYADGGELRTWNAQRNDDIDDHRKASTSVQIFPSKITHDYPYNPSPNEGEYIYDYERQRQQQYSTNRYSNQMNNSSYTQSSISTERDRIYDQSTRSYKDTDYTQESLYPVTPVRNSEVALRHYTLKRTNSYDGLGILISADIETRLNHRIRDIEKDSPGSRSGLRKNDRIIHVNGINVEKTDFTDVLLLIKQGLNNNNLQFSVINESTFI